LSTGRDSGDNSCQLIGEFGEFGEFGELDRFAERV
jgi:hypothetical protein